MPAQGDAPELVPPSRLSRLRRAVETIGRREPRNAIAFEGVLDALLATLRPLEQLHPLVPEVLARDDSATREFIAILEVQVARAGVGGRALDAHTPQWPDRPTTQPAERRRLGSGALPLTLSGGGHLLGGVAMGPMGGVGGSTIPIPGPSGGRGCGLVPFASLAGIGIATFVATASVDLRRGQVMFDTTTGMGLCIGAIESLFDAVVHHDLGRLHRRISWLADGWAGTPTLSGPQVLPDPRRVRGSDGLPGNRPGGLPGTGEHVFPERGGSLGPAGPGMPGGGGGWPNPGGPAGGGLPCPPVIPERCEIDRELCWLELMHELGRGGRISVPTNDHVHARGIAALQPSSVCSGNQVSIIGTGFGESQGLVEVRVPTGRGCVPVEVSSWSDERIDLVLPDDVTSGCIGFFDPMIADQGREAADRLNSQLGSINSWLACLQMTKVPHIPGPMRDRCPPCTEMNRLIAGPPRIGEFELVTDLPGIVISGEDVELRWLVDNTESIRLERVTTNGPSFDGATSVDDPPGQSYDLGVATHTAPQLWTYRLTATNGCGSTTQEVTAVATADPGLRVEAVEVSQGIQTEDHSVRLVRRKQGVIRVVPGHGLNGFGGGVVPAVTGRLRLRTGAEAWSPWFDPINGSSPTSPTPGAAISVVAGPDLANTDDTLNFLLPTHRAVGPLHLEVELRVDDYGAPSGMAGFSSQTARSFGPFAFHQRARVHHRYVRVRWQDTATAAAQTPTHEQCVDTLEGTMRRIPARLGSIEPLEGVGVQVAEVPTGTGDVWVANATRIVRELVEEFDDRHNCSLYEWLTQWLGSDCPEDDGAYWALIAGGSRKGRAAGIPSNTYLTSVGMNVAPHELGHSLGQLHIMVACPNGLQAQGGEPAFLYPNNGQLTDVPFDLDTNQTVTGANGVWDIMTYCDVHWTKPTRSQRLYDFIGP